MQLLCVYDVGACVCVCVCVIGSGSTSAVSHECMHASVDMHAGRTVCVRVQSGWVAWLQHIRTRLDTWTRPCLCVHASACGKTQQENKHMDSATQQCHPAAPGGAAPAGGAAYANLTTYLPSHVWPPHRCPPDPLPLPPQTLSYPSSPSSSLPRMTA